MLLRFMYKNMAQTTSIIIHYNTRRCLCLIFFAIIGIFFGLNHLLLIKNGVFSYSEIFHMINNPTGIRNAMSHQIGPTHKYNTNREYDYDAIYSSGGMHKSYAEKRVLDFQGFHNYTSPDISLTGCSLTVALTDPRIPLYGFNHSVWFMLESVASFVPYACIVIHTASCHIDNRTFNVPLLTMMQQLEVTARTIYEKSLPLFRGSMERGQVRIAILEKGNYNIRNCDRWDLSTITMNINFWREQFIDGVDSDYVMFVQEDSVLCRHLDISPWKKFAYVGSPWKREIFGGCRRIQRDWKSWAPLCNLTNRNFDLTHLCTPGHGGPVGNGGLSLRSRIWMMRVIETCPTEYSGLESHAHFGHPLEDMYFATILNGLQAPMPTAFEASLLFVETLFPDETFKHYNSLSSGEIEDTVKELWGNKSGILMYDRMNDIRTYIDNPDFINLPVLHIIPFGFHKPWKYHSKDVMNGVQLQNECKFLKFVYNEV